MQNETAVKVSTQPVTAAVGTPSAKASSAGTSAKLSAPRTPATPNINFYSPQVKSFESDLVRLRNFMQKSYAWMVQSCAKI